MAMTCRAQLIEPAAGTGSAPLAREKTAACSMGLRLQLQGLRLQLISESHLTSHRRPACGGLSRLPAEDTHPRPSRIPHSDRSSIHPIQRACPTPPGTPDIE